MHLSNESIRRMNDENYFPALEKFLQDKRDKEQTELENYLKERPWKRKRYEKLKTQHDKYLKSLSTEEFIEYLHKGMMNDVDDVTNFNKEWDKRYKVVHGKF